MAIISNRLRLIFAYLICFTICLLSLLVLFGIIGPKISFSTTSINLGIVEKGQILKYVFYVKNTGFAPLQILGLTSSCNCTVAKSVRTLILPGQSTKIEVHAVAIQLGRMSESILVKTNDKKKKEILLSVGAYVAGNLFTIPERLNCGTLRFSELPDHIEFHIRNVTGTLSDVYKILPQEAFISVEKMQRLSASDSKVTINILKTAPTGEWATKIACILNEKQTVSIPISCRLIGDATFSPNIIAFASAHKGSSSVDISFPSYIKNESSFFTFKPAEISSIYDVSWLGNHSVRLKLKKSSTPSEMSGFFIINWKTDRSDYLSSHWIPISGFSNTIFSAQ